MLVKYLPVAVADLVGGAIGPDYEPWIQSIRDAGEIPTRVKIRYQKGYLTGVGVLKRKTENEND